MKNIISISAFGFSLGALAAILISCASTTEPGVVGVGRTQFISDQLIRAEQVDSLAAKSYSDLIAEAKQKGLLDRDPTQVKRVDDIVKRLIAQTQVFRKDAAAWKWESHVITSDDVNAFCMPGGKMVIYTGIIQKLNLNDAEIAAIMGHEIAHALREHGRERMGQEAAKQGLLGTLVNTGHLDPNWAQVANLAGNYLLTLPYGRKQESEADLIGVELMARAGFDPKAAISLWQKMSKLAGKSSPEFLSTHPSNENRISGIQSVLSKVEPLYRAK